MLIAGRTIKIGANRYYHGDAALGAEELDLDARRRLIASGDLIEVSKEEHDQIIEKMLVKSQQSLIASRKREIDDLNLALAKANKNFVRIETDYRHALSVRDTLKTQLAKAIADYASATGQTVESLQNQPASVAPSAAVAVDNDHAVSVSSSDAPTPRAHNRGRQRRAR